MGAAVLVRSVLLAGGKSERFGEPKALVFKGGIPLVLDRYRMLQQIDPEPLVLAGGFAHEIRTLLPEAEVFSDDQGGPVAALALLPREGLHLIVAVDMPLLEARDLQAFGSMASGPAILGQQPATLPCLLNLPLDPARGTSLRAQLSAQQAPHLRPVSVPPARLAQFNTQEAWRALHNSEA